MFLLELPIIFIDAFKTHAALLLSWICAIVVI